MSGVGRGFSLFFLFCFVSFCPNVWLLQKSPQILNMKVTSGLFSILLRAANANRVLYFNKALLDYHSNESFLHPNYSSVRDLLDIASAEKETETCEMFRCKTSPSG